MNFWRNKPVQRLSSRYEDVEFIMDPDTLLKKIQSEMQESKIQLDYVVKDLSDENIQLEILNFINANYKQKHYSFEYSVDLFNYFKGKNYLALCFFPKGKNIMVGFVCGTKRTIGIRWYGVTSVLDVNFLCLHKNLRKLHASSFMINALTKECLLKFNGDVSCAVYTIGSMLRKPFFCKKQYYHRPIHMTNLLQSKMINECYGTDVWKKVYSTFSYTKTFKDQHTVMYINGTGLSHQLYRQLTEITISYYREKYYIYSLDHRLDEIALNKAFHMFIIKKNDIVRDFVCFYRLDTAYIEGEENEVLCKNGYIYISCFDKSDVVHKCNVLEFVYKYIYDNQIFDIVTTMDMFKGDEKDYYIMKYLPGSSQLYYYMYNMKMPLLSSFENELVTI